MLPRSPLPWHRLPSSLPPWPLLLLRPSPRLLPLLLLPLLPPTKAAH